MRRGWVERLDATMERLVRRWLPDLSEGGAARAGAGNRRTLVAIGEETPPRVALDVARSIARSDGDEIILARVVAGTAMMTGRRGLLVEEAAARQHLADVTRRLVAEGISVRTVVYPTRRAARAIDALAKELDADLVLHAGYRASAPPREDSHHAVGVGDTIFGTMTR